MEEITNNRKAYFDYEIIEKFEAGIELVGSEVKSLRQKQMSLLDAFVFLSGGEAFLKNAYIKPYDKSSAYLPDERRSRKLLLHKNEIYKLERGIKEKGYTIVPLRAYFLGKNAKVEIALARGKKNYDKREALKKKDLEREKQRIDA